jgi:putative transposase
LSEKGEYLTPKHEDFEHDMKLDVEARVRQGVKAVLEEVLQEEMTQHLEAGYRELTPTRRGERNGHYTRNLVTPAGRIERLEVPRDREDEFVTEVFERYKRMTGDVEEAVLEMYLSGISVRKIAGVTDALSRVRVGKDAVSRIARRLEEEQREWRERTLQEKNYPYLYLDATYLKVRRGARVRSMALLVCVGVDEEGFREVLAVEVAGTEKGAAYASLLRGLIDRGLSGVRLVVSDDHEGKKKGRRCYAPALDDSLLGPLLHTEGLGHLLREVGVVVHYLPSSSFTTVDVRHTPVDAYRLLSDAPLAMFCAQGVGGILAYGYHHHLI